VRSAVALVVLLAAACGGTDPHAATLPDIASMRCPSTISERALPVADASSLPALHVLSAREAAPIHGRIVHAGHGSAGAEAPVHASPALARELRAAAAIACRLRTPEAAERAGYTLSSVFDAGVGTHWTNWRLVDAPFDPERPSMLLFAPWHGEVQLVGFSYYVRAPLPPDGFAGTDDHWHRHFGLCFDARGMLERENVTDARSCQGTWLNGSDMWMLHAWTVPGIGNVWGVFAPLNPQLCSRTGPDIARCPGFS
jgi:hypothetical protein